MRKENRRPRPIVDTLVLRFSWFVLRFLPEEARHVTSSWFVGFVDGGAR